MKCEGESFGKKWQRVKAEDAEIEGDGEGGEGLQMAGCWLAVCDGDDDDDNDVMKWAPVLRAWFEPCVCVRRVCIRVCLLHPLGFLGFVMQPNIPVRWLNDRKWVRPPLHPRLFLSPSASASLSLSVTPFHFITPQTLPRPVTLPPPPPPHDWLPSRYLGHWLIPAWDHVIRITW